MNDYQVLEVGAVLVYKEAAPGPLGTTEVLCDMTAVVDTQI